MTQNTDFQRLERVKNFYHLLNYAEFSRQIGLKNQQIFTDIKHGKHKISAAFAQKIAERYPDISTAWLLTGQGTMIVDNSGDMVANTAGGDILGNGAYKSGEDSRLVDVIASQQTTIREQAETIKQLTLLLTKK